jgi:hypothetical protein
MWVIENQLEGAPLGDLGNMEVKDIIGKELSFSTHSSSCFLPQTLQILNFHSIQRALRLHCLAI